VEFAEDLVNWFKKPLPPCKEFFTFPTPINDADHRIDIATYSLIMFLNLAIMNYTNSLAVNYIMIFILLMKITSGPKLDPVAQFTVRITRPLFVNHWNLILNEYKPPLPRKRVSAATLNIHLIGIILFYTGNKYSYFVLYWLWLLGLCLTSIENLCLSCGLIWILVKYDILPKKTCVECRLRYKVTEKSDHTSSSCGVISSANNGSTKDKSEK
jgi:hypothetical protein